jgi:hypothetical protein
MTVWQIKDGHLFRGAEAAAAMVSLDCLVKKIRDGLEQLWWQCFLLPICVSLARVISILPITKIAHLVKSTIQSHLWFLTLCRLLVLISKEDLTTNSLSFAPDLFAQ